jgi:RHS repeat-associated protein
MTSKESVVMKRIWLMLLIALVTAQTAFAAEQVFFYHTDPAGTPLAMTNSSGTVVWKADYKPFGEEQSVTQTQVNDKRFVGKEKDTETGLSYFGARYESDKIGRFISADPIGPVNPKTSKTYEDMLLNPQKLNKYAYALNSPYRYVDIDGKEPLTIAAILANLFLPSTANAPESWNTPTVSSQTAAGFAGGVALLETGGRIASDAMGALLGGTGAPVARSLGAAALKTYFPEKQVMAKIFGVTEREFHQIIKKEIKEDVGNFPKWLGKNPDVGFSEAGNIILRNVETKKEFITNLSVEGYKR